MLIKTVVLIAGLLIALVFFQVFLIEYFSLNLPKNVAEKTTEVGWCLFFRCEKISYPSIANITGPSLEIGFDVGPEDLKFGQIPIGGGGKRFINVANDDKARAKVEFKSFGNISPYIYFEPKNFILETGEREDVTVELKAKPGMEAGYYSGGVTLIRFSAKIDYMDFLLEWV